MALSVWDPFTRFDSDFDQIVRRVWGRNVSREAFVPAVETVKDGSDVVIKVELPGVDVEKDVEIEVDNGRLTVSGRRSDTNEKNEGSVLVRELRYGAFRRAFALPEGVSADQVEAKYDKGLLELRVRDVTKPVEQPRKIAITRGE